MNKIYSSPFRVYLCFGLLLGAGIFSYFNMPVALFPNSTKPRVSIHIPYGSASRDSFINTYGTKIEADLRAVQTKTCKTDQIEGYYRSTYVSYHISFNWEDEGQDCLKEVEQIISSYKSAWPEDVQQKVRSHLDTSGTGFMLGIFHSKKRNAKEIYDLIEPRLHPKLSSIHEANKPAIVDALAKQITIELLPLKMASFKLLPSDVYTKIREQLKTYSSGVLNESGKNITIEINPDVTTIKDLKNILIARDANRQIYLSQIARIKLEASSLFQMVLKINGEAGVFIWVTPAPGKNIKKMSDKVLAAVDKTLALESIPEDIKFSLSIDPAELIDQSLSNVMQEVWLCSLIAVLILFIFIGSFVGTLTALIEIPTSIILSFIIMKLTGIQLNLISLGGLALSVGMNVDASIVVIDSIIKKFKDVKMQKASYFEIVKIVEEAVREVAVPVIVATITSLIVFIPLTFTSDLSNAILGDLAKAVIYSHGISLFIALFLVPTIRIHIAHKFGSFAEDHSITWLDKMLEKLYAAYTKSLTFFIKSGGLRYTVYVFLFVLTAAVVFFIPQKLKREIIGKPDTAIIISFLSTQKNKHINEMEEMVAKFERRVDETFPGKVAFTFSQIGSPGGAFLAIHLNEKKDFKSMLENLQAMTKDELDIRYHFDSFNPGELPIPNPPDWRVEFKARDIKAAQKVLDHFRATLLETGVVENISEDSTRVFDNKLLLKPYAEKWNLLKASGARLHHNDLADIITLATEPQYLGRFTVDNKELPLIAQYPKNLISSKTDISSLPIPLGEKVVPLRALTEIIPLKEPSELLRLNGENVFKLEGRFSEKEKKDERKVQKDFAAMLKSFKEDKLPKIAQNVSVERVDAKVELTKALNELLLTIAISISLIFLVLLIQFSSVVHSLIIMLAIPFGILGVFLSLYAFNSTLSLNSALGIILLVGITVANSIMLVEMILKLARSGMQLELAVIETAKKRIRPILMTSLTTILGMLPIAIGLGDGGKVLQPLGIAVCGGLWVSLIFTLYIIPALEYSYLRRKERIN